MMNRAIPYLTGWVLFTAPLWSQTGIVKGNVFDAESKQALAGASVVIEGTKLGGVVEPDGTFFLSRVPAGHAVIIASCVGYKTRRVELDVPPDKTIETTILLVPEAIPLMPVIVTATMAKERETPVTFVNLNQTEIRDRYIAQDVPAVLSELPSIVTYSENGNDMGYTHLTMRGFDERRIAVMVNGVPQNDPEDHIVYWIDMPDLLAYTQSVQLMRGAGSDFYGPPAIGGSINFVTTPLAPKPSVTLTSAFGFQTFGDENRTVLNTRKYGIAFNSGVIGGKYALLGNFSTTNSSGYRQHSWIDISSYFVGVARFDESMTTRIHIYGGPLRDGLAYNGIPKFYNNDLNLRCVNYNYFGLDSTGNNVLYPTLRKPQENESFSQPHIEILNDWRISPAVKLYNTFFYIQGDGYFDYDGDWIPYPDPSTGKPTTAMLWFMNHVGYDSTFGSSTVPSFLLRAFVGNKQWGWLSRVEIDHRSDGGLLRVLFPILWFLPRVGIGLEGGTLTIGGELRIHRSVHWGSIPFASVYPANYNPDFHFYQFNGRKDMASLYGHEVYHWDARTTVMADFQLAYNRYGFGNEEFLGTSFSVPYLFVNLRGGMNYAFTDEINAYYSIGLTSREPRLGNLYTGEGAYYGATPSFEGMTVNRQTTYNFEKPLAKPERLLDVEVGTSLTSVNGKISVNLYWMEFADELINNGKLDIFGVPVTGNAERTRHVGVELAAQQKLDDAFDVSGNVTLSRNRLVRYSVYDDITGILESFDGNPISGFPDVLANARITYREESFTASLLGKYVGAFYTDNTRNGQRKVDAYTVFDLDASYVLRSLSTGTSVTVHGKIRNLLDRLYFAGGQGIEFFPAAERNYVLALALGF